MRAALHYIDLDLEVEVWGAGAAGAAAAHDLLAGADGIARLDHQVAAAALRPVGAQFVDDRHADPAGVAAGAIF